MCTVPLRVQVVSGEELETTNDRFAAVSVYETYRGHDLGNGRRPLPTTLQGDGPCLLSFVPIDGPRLSFMRTVVNGAKSHAGDQGNRFAGRPGNGAIEFGLGHRFFAFMQKTRKSDRPELGAAV